LPKSQVLTSEINTPRVRELGDSEDGDNNELQYVTGGESEGLTRLAKFSGEFIP